LLTIIHACRYAREKCIPNLLDEFYSEFKILAKDKDDGVIVTFLLLTLTILPRASLIYFAN